jgi:ClpP class serine protease
MLALDAALNAVWAMDEQALERLLDIAARQNEPTPEMLEAYRAKNLAGAEKAKISGKVAILNATGPMFKRASLMTALSGATSYDVLRRDLQAAVDAGVNSLLLNIDTPGGEASGVNELAQAVHDMRDQMHIVAYVGGTGASAGYWLASAAHEIVVDPTAMLGSIGVQVAFAEPGTKAGEKRFRFVSSQSPLKNADPASEEGAAGIQATIDAMAQVFVQTVARNRGVATETVLNEFGKGGIFVGQGAVSAGLADRIGSYESVLAELSARKSPKKGRTGAKATMDDETFTAEQRNAAVAAAVTADRDRVAGLQTLAATFGTPPAELTAAIAGGQTIAAFSLEQAGKAGERAAAAKAKADADEATRIEALKKDEEDAAAAGASSGNEPEPNGVDAVAARISAA